MKQGIDDFYVFSHPPQDIDAQSLAFLDNPLVAIAHQGTVNLTTAPSIMR